MVPSGELHIAAVDYSHTHHPYFCIVKHRSWIGLWWGLWCPDFLTIMLIWCLLRCPTMIRQGWQCSGTPGWVKRASPSTWHCEVSIRTISQKRKAHFTITEHQAHFQARTSSVRNSGTLLVPESDPQFTIVAKALRQIQIPSLSGTLKALGPALCRLGPPSIALCEETSLRYPPPRHWHWGQEVLKIFKNLSDLTQFKVSDRMVVGVFQWPNFAMRTFFVGSDDCDGGQKEAPPCRSRPSRSIFSHVLARGRIIPRIQPWLGTYWAFLTLNIVQTDCNHYIYRECTWPEKYWQWKLFFPLARIGSFWSQWSFNTLQFTTPF